MALKVYTDVEQRSEEWFKLRCGIVTASTVGQLITVGSPDAQTVACPTCGVEVGPCLSVARKAPTLLKTVHETRTARVAEQPPVYSAANNDTARGLTTRLVAERIAGFIEETSMTSDMWRGVDSEPFARDLYSKHHAPVTEVGFMVREEEWGTLGYSPDGLVGDDGLIEIKAPRAKSHLAAVLADEVPAHNMAQLQGGLLVSDRAWADFIPFVGGLPLWVKRVYPDPAYQAAIVAAVKQFEDNAAQMVAAYQSATKGLPATERVLFGEVELKL